MRLRNALLVLPLALGESASAEVDAQPRIALTASTPLVSVAPRPAGRHFVDLPELEFSFDIDAQCSDDWVAESLFLNVADTRLTFNTEQLAGNEHNRIVLRVSERQLAPIAVHDFCATESVAGIDGEAAPGSSPTEVPVLLDVTEVTISAALSAHASLRCASDGQRRVAYISQPLDLMLACEDTSISEGAD